MKKRGINKLFKEELEHLEGDFQVEHWEAMEALLDERDKPKRRPLILWLCLMGLMVGGISAYFVLNSADADIRTPRTSSVDLAAQKESDVSLKGESMEIQQEGKETIAQNKESKKEINIQESNSKNVVSDKNKIDEELTTEKPILNTRKIPLNTGASVVQEDAQDSAQNNKSDKFSEVLSIVELKKSERTDRSDLTQETAQGSKVIQNKQELNALDSKIKPVDRLELITSLLKFSQNVSLSKAMILATAAEDAGEDKPTRVYYASGLGVYLSSEWYPYSGIDVQQFRGYSAGVQYTKVLQSRFAISGGLGLRQMYGTFGATDESVQTVFNGFGWTRDFHSYKPTTAFYLETPIYAEYFIGRHRFSLGARLQKLLAIRAEHIIEAYDQTQLVNTTRENVNPLSTRSSTNWVRSSAFNDVRGELALSYGLAFAPRWSIQMEGRYGLNGILINDDDQDLLREYRPFSASVRLNIKL